ncbi:discoidin domain-containing protein [Actinocorallia longicatena]|uniref:Discoidin domain-containing protein n=1 Tax=Actinocorallia longicatena TaxID=111803 RepID=A0ABP6QL63_9ACTN
MRTSPWRTRLTAGCAAIGASIACAVGLVAPPAQAAPALLSQGRTATTSSTENGGTPAQYAFDGDTGTRWSSAAADPQWLQVDLGASASLTKVVLTWETAYGRDYKVQASADGTTWTDLKTVAGGDGGVDSWDIAGNGRYVRMLGTARATGYGYSLWEFQVFGETGDGGSCGTADAARGRPASASSTENGGTPASAAFDGDSGTRWSSAAADPQWLRVDLGSARTICRIDLNWEAAYGRDFTLETSADGASWSVLKTVTGGTGGRASYEVSGSGRYVRVHGTARATGYGYSLWDVAVHTTGGGETDPGGDVLLSYGRTGAASSSQDDGTCRQCVPARAFDLDPASRWATSPAGGWSDPGWISVDLGATAQIHKIVLQWDPAYATAYQIQTSPDGQTWTTIYSTTTGKGFKETLTVNGTGRHVRMYGTQRNGPYGYALWEFQVHGTGGAPITPPARPADPASPPTTLVFSDEFGAGAGTKPDAAKWKADPGTGQNGELQYYTDNANASTDGQGNLVIEARKQATPGASCPTDPLTGSGTCQYTSGRINTSTTFSTTYGKVEARIKIPAGAGLWPAFWMLGADFLTGRPWPYSGEIDIMEILGKEPNKLYSTLHAPAYNGAGGHGGTLLGPGSYADAFHTYAVEWNSTSMRFTMDAQTVVNIDRDALEATRGPWVFDHPFYIILNLAVGGDFPGPPATSTPFPARMLVDYVRVYK